MLHKHLRKFLPCLIVGLTCFTKLTAAPYVIIRGILKIEGRECYIISYSIYDDRGTADRSDDIRIVSKNAAIGRGCDVGNLVDDNAATDREMSTQGIEFRFLSYTENNEYIELSLASDFDRIDIEIMESSGRVLFRDLIKDYKRGYRYRINKNNFMAGIYILKVRSGEGYYAVKSIYKF